MNINNSGSPCFVKILAGLIIYHRNITVTSQWAQPFVQAEIIENMKTPRYYPLWGESTGDQLIPLTKGQKRGKWAI